MSPMAAGLAADLEELRRSVVRHLDTLESLAQARQEAPRTALDWIEQEGDRSRELSAQFEHDRKLLAEAWERLERERLPPGGPLHGGSTATRTPRPVVCEAGPSHAPDGGPHAAPSQASQPNHVTDAILRQFQTLSHDVRSTTDARFPSR